MIFECTTCFIWLFFGSKSENVWCIYQFHFLYAWLKFHLTEFPFHNSIGFIFGHFRNLLMVMWAPSAAWWERLSMESALHSVGDYKSSGRFFSLSLSLGDLNFLKRIPAFPYRSVTICVNLVSKIFNLMINLNINFHFMSTNFLDNWQTDWVEKFNKMIVFNRHTMSKAKKLCFRSGQFANAINQTLTIHIFFLVHFRFACRMALERCSHLEASYNHSRGSIKYAYRKKHTHTHFAIDCIFWRWLNAI